MKTKNKAMNKTQIIEKQKNEIMRLDALYLSSELHIAYLESHLDLVHPIGIKIGIMLMKTINAFKNRTDIISRRIREFKRRLSLAATIIVSGAL